MTSNPSFFEIIQIFFLTQGFIFKHVSKSTQFFPGGKTMEEKKYYSVRIKKGPKGWGGPLVITPKPGKDLIYSVTGGGIHPLVARIAELSGGTPFDGFKSKAAFEEIAVVVIDCGGTARVGVYPMKKVPTVDIYSVSPSGPLFRFITEDIFVSGVRLEDIERIEK